MASQNLIWTVLPNGMLTGPPGPATSQTFLQFSVLISPRLTAGATLADFPDWAASAGTGRTWPDTLSPVTFGLQFLDLPGAPVLPATRLTTAGTPATVGVPTPGVWAARFPATTPVVPYTYPGPDLVALRSYPMAAVSDFLAYQYGRFGTLSPLAFPTYASLAAGDAFGPIGFEEDETVNVAGPGGLDFGPATKARLLAELDARLASGPIPDIPFVPPSDPDYASHSANAFLQAETFLRRNLPRTPSGSPPTSPAPPAQDFAQLVGFAGSMPTLLRLLGLVIDCVADPAALPGLAGGISSRVSLVLDGFQPLLGGTASVLPQTQCTVTADRFAAVPLPGSEYADGMVQLGDPSLYRVIEVDPDGGAIKARQVADTVTRSRRNHTKLTQSTPDTFSLPALRTGGFALARTGRAVQMEATFARQRTELEGNADFSSSPTTTPLLYADDLVRGTRIDVREAADGIWRSLMWRFVDDYDPGDGERLTIVEEDSVVPAPTTAPQSTTPDDLYLQDSLTNWGGWSLAVPRYGVPLQDPSVPQGTPPPALNWDVPAWQVPGDGSEATTGNTMKLPRLRFGRRYQFRARTADHAGNGLTQAEAAIGGAAVTDPVTYLRFEPVEAPRVLLTAPHTPGESAEVIVIRSESLHDDGTGPLDNGTALRLLIPARTSQSRAEQHGAFDQLLAPGQPLDATLATWTELATRDQAPIASPPIAQVSPADPTAPSRQAGEVYYQTDALPIAYLPDVLAGVMVVRLLPPSSGAITATMVFDTAGNGWPDYQACRVQLARSTPTSAKPGGVAANWDTVVYTPSGGTATTELDLNLPKGQVVTTFVNALVGADELELMAVRDWIITWAAAHGRSSKAALELMAAGFHWMITPWREVTFVHAVRTPLAAPVLEIFPGRQTIGQTTADFLQSRIDIDRASTGRLDLLARWSMPVDTGSNPDPVTPQHFRATAFSRDIDREGDDVLEISEVEEFNDTKFRAVAYQGVATTSFLEFFRETASLTLAADGTATVPGFVFNPATVELYTVPTSPTDSPQRLIAAPPGTPVHAQPAPGDYVVVAPDPFHPGASQSIALLTHGSAAQALGGGSAPFTLSYVGPTIYNFSKVLEADIPNSARPAAPDVQYIVPIYQRSATASGVTRTGGGLRVYLNRPWWSSGDQERLAVVCCPSDQLDSSGDPPADLVPYVTQWGFDPVFESTIDLPPQPSPVDFPLRVERDQDFDTFSLAEGPFDVSMAGHEVGFDPHRNLWYCDIQLRNQGAEIESYMPFVRLALARFQRQSLADANLSKVVLTDFAQLAPNRALTVTGPTLQQPWVLFQVTVAGRAPVASHASPHPSRLTVTVEQRDPRIADDALAWSPLPDLGAQELGARVRHDDEVTWSGTVRFLEGSSSHPLRLTFQEYERFGSGTSDERLVYTETFPLGS